MPANKKPSKKPSIPEQVAKRRIRKLFRSGEVAEDVLSHLQRFERSQKTSVLGGKKARELYSKVAFGLKSKEKVLPTFYQRLDSAERAFNSGRYVEAFKFFSDLMAGKRLKECSKALEKKKPELAKRFSRKAQAIEEWEAKKEEEALDSFKEISKNWGKPGVEFNKWEKNGIISLKKAALNRLKDTAYYFFFRDEERFLKCGRLFLEGERKVNRRIVPFLKGKNS